MNVVSEGQIVSRKVRRHLGRQVLALLHCKNRFWECSLNHLTSFIQAPCYPSSSSLASLFPKPHSSPREQHVKSHAIVALFQPLQPSLALPQQSPPNASSLGLHPMSTLPENPSRHSRQSLASVHVPHTLPLHPPAPTPSARPPKPAPYSHPSQ